MDTEMEFNVAQLLKEGVGGKRSYEFGMPELVLSEALSGDPAALVAHEVHGTVKLTGLRGQVRAVGTVAAAADLVCSRCLEPFVQPVESALDELFRQTIDVVSGHTIKDEVADEEADEAFQIDQNHILDLTEPVRQTLLVALPMSPLHSADCRGLCPTCGTNLNLGACDCPTEDLDPRLSALSRLLISSDDAAGPAHS
ncbi:MAG: DUF177 domain-containing protein [Chloroflexota bacterium]|nr:DUF177 domain-containing protein [Chloroflexota bacterium]